MQVLPVATHLPPGYLSIQPLGLGKGVRLATNKLQTQPKTTKTSSISERRTRNHLDRLAKTHLHRHLPTALDRLHPGPSPAQPLRPRRAHPREQALRDALRLGNLQNTESRARRATADGHHFPAHPAQSAFQAPGAPGQRRGRPLRHQAAHTRHQHGPGSWEERDPRELRQSGFCPSRSKSCVSNTPRFLQFVFSSPGKGNGVTVHERLARHLTTLLQPSNADFLVVNKYMHHSSFFFEIMIKSMSQHLLDSGRIKVSRVIVSIGNDYFYSFVPLFSQMHRNERFSEEFHDKIKGLLVNLVPHLVNKYKELPLETQELNKSLAHFLKVCVFSVERKRQIYSDLNDISIKLCTSFILRNLLSCSIKSQVFLKLMCLFRDA